MLEKCDAHNDPAITDGLNVTRGKFEMSIKAEYVSQVGLNCLCTLEYQP